MLAWIKSFTWDKLAGVMLMLVLHVLVIYAAMSYQLIPPTDKTVTLMVSLIKPPSLEKEAPPPPEVHKLPPEKVVLGKPKPKPIDLSKPVLVAEAPVTNTSEYVAPPPPPEPIVNVAPVPEPVVAAPPPPPASVTLTSELSLACPQRTLPNYPVTSRRNGEQGRVVLRVALDETGRITAVNIKKSSGFQRLDEAGVAVIKDWKCNAAMRDGVAVRAEALQPFDFILN